MFEGSLPEVLSLLSNAPSSTLDVSEVLSPAGKEPPTTMAPSTLKTIRPTLLPFPNNPPVSSFASSFSIFDSSSTQNSASSLPTTTSTCAILAATPNGTLSTNTLVDASRLVTAGEFLIPNVTEMARLSGIHESATIRVAPQPLLFPRGETVHLPTTIVGTKELDDTQEAVQMPHNSSTAAISTYTNTPLQDDNHRFPDTDSNGNAATSRACSVTASICERIKEGSSRRIATKMFAQSSTTPSQQPSRPIQPDSASRINPSKKPTPKKTTPRQPRSVTRTSKRIREKSAGSTRADDKRFADMQTSFLIDATVSTTPATTPAKRAWRPSETKRKKHCEDIRKYSLPGEDLDWTIEPDAKRRRSLQSIISHRRRSGLFAAPSGDVQIPSKSISGLRNGEEYVPSIEIKHTTQAVPLADTNIASGLNLENPLRTTGRMDSARHRHDTYANPCTPTPHPTTFDSEQSPCSPTSSSDSPSRATTDFSIPAQLKTRNSLQAADLSDIDLSEIAADEDLCRLKLQEIAVYQAWRKGVIQRESLMVNEVDKQEQDDELVNSKAGETISRPRHDLINDARFVDQVKDVLQTTIRDPSMSSFARRCSLRILRLLDAASPPTTDEALFLDHQEAKQWLAPGAFFPGPIITQNQQTFPLQTVQQFVNEYYDDTIEVYIQDPGIDQSRNTLQVRPVTIAQIKERFEQAADSHPWNCLELATHCDDGLRPAFLDNEDCRLLTKIKIPGREQAARRGYLPGWKEVEKWALLAQGGALTEPHQDSHGYNTYITVNAGPIGFGWLANPDAPARAAWSHDPLNLVEGPWRYVVLAAGQTVYFPSGTVHFVFRLPAAGNTLAFGGHVLRCSQIVAWVRTLLDEKANPNITNEDLSVSAPAYLDRVARYVQQAIRTGGEDRWGGVEACAEFLRLKKEFLSR